MLSLDAAFDRIGSAFQKLGYAASERTPPDASGNRQAVYTLPTMAVRICSYGRARLLTVQVWDRGMVKATEKAIREAGLGLNPQTEGQTIRVPIPDLNQERRQELVKVANKYAEQARVAVRNVRRDGMDMLKKQEKAGTISQDEHKTWSEKVQTLTDTHIKKIDELLAGKEKDILQV